MQNEKLRQYGEYLFICLCVLMVILYWEGQWELTMKSLRLMSRVFLSFLKA